MKSKSSLWLLLLLFSATTQFANSTIDKNANPENVLRDVITYIEGHFTLQVVPRENGTANDCIDDDGSPLDEFPEFFTEDQLRQGWIAIHIFAAIYFFVLLAMVCNDYFLPTVECICDDLHLSKDVAAATFMATATSMPEFFTNTISTLITESDMGLGTIIGSLMFNTLGVAGLAALAINKPIQLDWWPIARDCFIYLFNTAVLLCIAWGGKITFLDTCIMMVFLILYFILTFNNNTFMKYIRGFVEDKLNCCFSTRYDLTLAPEHSAKAKLPLKKEDINGNGIFVVNTIGNSSVASNINLTHSKSWNEDEVTIEMPDKLFELPRGKSITMKVWWAYSWPIRALLSCIIPNPITRKKWYPLTFIMCIIIIGCNAYLIVWMLTALGVTLGVPDIIMGLTFLAAGSTTPEAVSSLISVRKGESGIGVSNSLGANSLAILLSLGVPWFIKNCINYHKTDGSNAIYLTSQGIEYTIFILMASTFSLFIILSFSGYRLTKKAGIALFTVYTIFIALQILIEMNVFFPKQC
ncbi:sodium/potassium/calcium exchanger 3 isoform X1 [Episyrphus balteatus]|uniref:sodium/potassium/calcium exchanger 3 isoform X1 n=1 Tax=Episyrphus balteatus TaxID=286459 RepID=UPI00248572BB|nr:sodium/potassium/calcium exchanger 3 isoform X1 [Episyrphus balteatus]